MRRYPHRQDSPLLLSLFLLLTSLPLFHAALARPAPRIPRDHRLFELDSGDGSSSSSFLVFGSRTAKRRFWNAAQKARRELSELAQEHRRLTQQITVLKKPGHYHETELKQLKRRQLAVLDRTRALRRRAEATRKNEEAPSSKTLGRGGFADVLLGHQTNNENYPVAVKLSRRPEDAPLLLREAELIQKLGALYPSGFSRVLHTERLNEKHGVGGRSGGVAIVLDLLGPSLEDLWWACTCGVGGFSSSTTLRIAKEMLRILEKLQKAGIAHRDIQPANILLGRTPESSHLPHLIDFGIAGYIDQTTATTTTTTNSSTPNSNGKVLLSPRPAFSGTPRFASVAALRGRGGGYRAVDDLESLCYTLAFLRTGEAPWSESLEENARTPDGARVLAGTKQMIEPEALCRHGEPDKETGKGDPASKAIGELLEHVRQCGENHDNAGLPSYVECHAIVENAMMELESKEGKSPLFDWEQSSICWCSQTGVLENTLYSGGD